MNDRTYNVRMHCASPNPFDIDLRGYGSYYIRPGKDYFFTNAPMSFINYLVQLKNMGITYELTNNKKGCFEEVDLAYYDIKDPRYILAGLRNSKKVINEKDNVNVENKVSREVVLASDDNIKVKPVVVKKAEEVLPPVELPTSPITEPQPEETNDTLQEITLDEEDTKETKVSTNYTEEELSKLSKIKLLEIAASLEINSVSDINTKKEIREAILAKQNK